MENENTSITIDEYIELADQNVRDILCEIRKTIRENAPSAQECMRYNMPAFKHKRPFIYFAAFKKHIGIFPPVSNDQSLIIKLSNYRNDKGNLRFSLKEPVPYELIGQVAKALYKQYS